MFKNLGLHQNVLGIVLMLSCYIILDGMILIIIKKELAALVIDQGSALDRIDYNMEQMVRFMHFVQRSADLGPGDAQRRKAERATGHRLHGREF